VEIQTLCERSCPHELGIGSLLRMGGCAVVWHGVPLV
jgi:hypothetical protein